MKHGIQSQKVVAEVIKQKPTVRWLFLTLTVRNVYDGTELNKSLSDMSKGFNRMMKYKKINKNLVGFMRATEVTVNNIDNSYNQHMHVLVCVESTYFYNTENYVNQKQWIQFWKRAMKLDYDPNVKVQMIRPKNKHKSDVKSAIDETAKYLVKDIDFTTHVRYGISLYGLSLDSKNQGLIPVMKLKTKIVSLKSLKKGECVGYSQTYCAIEDEIIGILPIGYADGFLRRNKHGDIEIKNKRYQLVGNICMDACFAKVDTSIKVGDVVTLFGGLVSIDEVAKRNKTINYEIVTSISYRVPKKYINE